MVLVDLGPLENIESIGDALGRVVDEKIDAVLLVHNGRITSAERLSDVERQLTASGVSAGRNDRELRRGLAPIAQHTTWDRRAMYETYWRLKQKPFENAADPRFYYPAESHQAALLKLRYAIENRRGAGLLVGPSGSGKTLVTTMLRGIARRAVHAVRASRVSANVVGRSAGLSGR